MAAHSSNIQCSPQSQQHRLDRALSRLRQRVLERSAAASATPRATKEAVVQLPWWHDLDRAIPNHLARSSLFAPVARGRRATHEGKVLTSRSDVQLRYWGVQLDEPDSDVWMQALHEARRHPVGAPVPVVRSHFLKSLGRHIGSTDYGWLHESFLRLSLGMLEIKTRKYTVGEVPGDATPSKGIHRVLHLIDGFDLDEELDTYVLRIDRRMVRLFSNREFALIDWEKRLQIKVQRDMAKALQRLVATSSDATQRHSLAWLKDKLQYSSPISKFREPVLAAAAELERLGIIAGARLEQSTHGKEQIVWTRL
ncbi:plasmid replication initiator TrfA [Roseateles sp.]|uniref:plasmid replication initiator TrfA n=1 Tax=Roseateles sp. TaxID=1971397 RepID=UPI003955D2FA